MSLALAAIIVSGFTLAWTIGWSIYTHRQATRPRISLRASWGFPVYDMPGGGQHLDREASFSLTATNIGQATVTLSSAKFLIRGKGGDSVVPIDWVMQTPGSLPIRLEPGAHWFGLVQAGSVKSTLDRQFGFRSHWHVGPVLTDTADPGYRAKVTSSGWRRLLPGRWMKLEQWLVAGQTGAQTGAQGG